MKSTTSLRIRRNALALALVGAVGACKTGGGGGALREAEGGETPVAVAPDTADGPCGAKPILVVASASPILTLKGGEKYPTGVFLRELTDPLVEFVRNGCRLEFATPGGVPPTIDSNSLELLWTYYPYPFLKPDAVKHRDEALRLATVAYGRLRFSDEKPQWPRLTKEVQDLVAAYREKQGPLTEKPPQDLAKVADRLEELDRQNQPSPYAGIFVPGGHVPMEDLVVSADFGRTLNHFHAHGLPSGLICHAPVAILATKQVGAMTYTGYRVAVAERIGEQMLEEMGPLQGYHVKSYVDDDLESNGVILNQNPWPGYPQVVADRELITGQNPASAPFMAQTFLESIAQYRAGEGKTGWWESRSLYVVGQSLRDEQQRIMVKNKAVANKVVAAKGALDAKRRFFFKILGSDGPGAGATGNIFLNPTYLKGFDAAMTLAIKGSNQGTFPLAEAPRSLMYEFKAPVLEFNATLNPFHIVEKLHNYFYVFPETFYKYDIDALESKMATLL